MQKEITLLSGFLEAQSLPSTHMHTCTHALILCVWWCATLLEGHPFETTLDSPLSPYLNTAPTMGNHSAYLL